MFDTSERIQDAGKEFEKEVRKLIGGRKVTWKGIECGIHSIKVSGFEWDNCYITAVLAAPMDMHGEMEANGRGDGVPLDELEFSAKEDSD